MLYDLILPSQRVIDNHYLSVKRARSSRPKVAINAHVQEKALKEQFYDPWLSEELEARAGLKDMLS